MTAYRSPSQNRTDCKRPQTRQRHKGGPAGSHKTARLGGWSRLVIDNLSAQLPDAVETMFGCWWSEWAGFGRNGSCVSSRYHGVAEPRLVQTTDRVPILTTLKRGRANTQAELARSISMPNSKITEKQLDIAFAEMLISNERFRDWVLSGSKFSHLRPGLRLLSEDLSRSRRMPAHSWRHVWCVMPDGSEGEADIFAVFEADGGY